MATDGANGPARTIFAVSSGMPPAAIGIIRISGPQAGDALSHLTGRHPESGDLEPRLATLCRLRGEDGTVLDEALVLWFPGPRSATGEDCAELHCHGGRAVLAAVCDALGRMPGLREAEPGEFTRRAFANGRIDLAEAEGLADLLAAETELQRIAAVANAGGALSRTVDEWRERVLRLSALVEAALDFSDEDDVGELPAGFASGLESLTREIGNHLERPRAERLGEGFRVVVAGPPNTGKSTLFNALVEDEAAITSPIAGTTRDVIERGVAISGVPLLFIDTAGLRAEAGEAIEAIGMDRARVQLDRADLVLWLGREGDGPPGAREIDARCDLADTDCKSDPWHRVSAVTGKGLETLKRAIVEEARCALPKPDQAALNARQHALLADAHASLQMAGGGADLLIAGEELRRVRLAFDRLTGRATTEDMLDTLFGRFCIGK